MMNIKAACASSSSYPPFRIKEPASGCQERPVLLGVPMVTRRPALERSGRSRFLHQMPRRFRAWKHLRRVLLGPEEEEIGLRGEGVTPACEEALVELLRSSISTFTWRSRALQYLSAVTAAAWDRTLMFTAGAPCSVRRSPRARRQARRAADRPGRSSRGVRRMSMFGWLPQVRQERSALKN